MRNHLRWFVVAGFTLLISGIAVFGAGVVDFRQDPLFLGLGYGVGFIGFSVLIGAWFATLE